MQVHRETLEEEATHVSDEARMAMIVAAGTALRPACGTVSPPSAAA